MRLRPLTVIALIFAAAPAAAEDIRLFAPVPNGPSPMEQGPVEKSPAQQADAIRLFSPAPSKPASQPKAPPIRGAVREVAPAEALPADRTWTVALP